MIFHVVQHGDIRSLFSCFVPLNTWHNDNVVITSKRHHFDVITSKWRRFDVITTLSLHYVFAGVFAVVSHTGFTLTSNHSLVQKPRDISNNEYSESSRTTSKILITNRGLWVTFAEMGGYDRTSQKYFINDQIVGNTLQSNFIHNSDIHFQQMKHLLTTVTILVI